MSSEATREQGAGSGEPVSDVTQLVTAVEKRFGLRLHVGFHTVLAERAFRLVGQFGATRKRTRPQPKPIAWQQCMIGKATQVAARGALARRD